MQDDISIVPLTPSRKEDYLAFFDGDAFRDNPAWAGCYCAYYHTPVSMQWAERSAPENRDMMGALIEQHRANGLLAYHEGRVVGWVNTGHLIDLPHCQARMGIPAADPDAIAGTAAVVCFLIAPAFRHKGLARLLLQACCDYFAAQGLDFIEAYPLAPGKADLDADHFNGPAALYAQAGFEVVCSGNPHWTVRKRLRPAPGRD